MPEYFTDDDRIDHGRKDRPTADGKHALFTPIMPEFHKIRENARTPNAQNVVERVQKLRRAIFKALG